MFSMLYTNIKINRNRKGLIHKIERHQNLYDEEIYDKLDELVEGYNKIIERLDEDGEDEEIRLAKIITDDNREL